MHATKINPSMIEAPKEDTKAAVYVLPDTNLTHNSLKPEIQALLAGNISSQLIQDGLHIHFGEFTELEAKTIESTLSAGISFNLVFGGQAIFALEDNYYQIGNNTQDLEYSFFALNKPVSFKRLLRPGMKLKKLNIFVEKRWFDKRIQNTKQKEQISALFEQHAVVHSCRAPRSIIEIAKSLMQASVRGSLGSEIFTEACVLQILSILIEHDTPVVFSDTAIDQQVSQLIWEETRGNNLSLQEIADHLGLSISTLQRRFKQQVGMTVFEFTRYERLEKAKHALTHNHLTIGEAAYLSGYQHTSNFISAFSKQYEISPGQYVKKHLSDHPE
ncbi:AraC family transcriptional regulator [Leucothrix sargassi]|nr:AraC family transcriptional regulator [Leucothrix sargassi]